MPVDPGPQAPAKPGGPAQRPSAGPVVPLTVSRVAPEELMGGGRAPFHYGRHRRAHPHQGRAGRGAERTGRRFQLAARRVNVEPATPEPGAPDPNAPDAKAAKPGQKTSAADGEAAQPAAEQKRRPRHAVVLAAAAARPVLASAASAFSGRCRSSLPG